MTKVIGICGFIGCGKDTAADYFVNFHGFKRDSFANSLKDAVASVFSWDREMLEGRTKQAREQREKVDEWWAKRLNMPHLTPRWVLQYWGTEVCRRSFHDDTWIASLEARIMRSASDVVISDVRFPNEIKAIKNAGGKVIWVKRGELPIWHGLALSVNKGMVEPKNLTELGVHASETAWVGADFDYEIENNGTIDDFYKALENVV